MIVDAETCCRIELGSKLSLRLAPARGNEKGFPSSRLQKGLILACAGEDLCQEGVGFGVPVLKKKLDPIFAGSMRILSRDEARSRISVEYEMNLVERLKHSGSRSPMTGFFNGLKEIAAAVHRRVPLAREMVTALSNVGRAVLGIQTVFVPSQPVGKVRVDFCRESQGEISVAVDTSGLEVGGLSEIIVMNEQGADHFCRYRDSNGRRLEGKAIGTWDRVLASQASFIDPSRGIGFGVQSVSGATLFRGREREEGRLAWAGFAFVLPPGAKSFTYRISIGDWP